jgi:hypothetical protein
MTTPIIIIVIIIIAITPHPQVGSSSTAILENAHALARYAQIAQVGTPSASRRLLATRPAKALHGPEN